MKKEISELKIKDFANLIGTSKKDIFAECFDLIKKFDFHYRNAESDKKDEIVANILKKIDSGDLVSSGKHRKERWEEGWNENLNEFIDNNQDVEFLIPKYMGNTKPLRFQGKYIMPEDPMFEMHWLNVFRMWIFKKYFSDKDAIYEFGCGTGHNLVALANIFPKKKLYGFDWVPSSMKILDLLASKYDYPIKGQVFDLFTPDKNVNFSKNSAMLTIDALEQLGPNYHQFLGFILEKKPSLCINIEPIIEFYDKNNFFDSLAIKYHVKRNYLNGYFTELENLQRSNKIEILNAKRVFFGSLYHDAYSYIVWKPK